MQQGQTDQSLQIKKRARRRLVGAIALVLLMIIILPMLLEDRDINGTNQTVDIIMPGQDAEEVATTGLDEALQAPVQLPEGKATEIDVDEVAEVKIDTPPTKPVAKPVKKPAPAKKEVVEVKKPQPAQQPAPTKTATANNNQYYVQIGVFSNPANISTLQTKLNDLGYDSFTEKLNKDGSVKTRLRTKSFDGRNEAAIALENIKDAGLTGMVVSEK